MSLVVIVRACKKVVEDVLFGSWTVGAVFHQLYLDFVQMSVEWAVACA